MLRPLIFAVSVAVLLSSLTASAEPPAKTPPPKAEKEELKRTVALILEPARKRDADRVGQLTNLLVQALTRRKIDRARLLAPYDPTALANGRRDLSEARKDVAGDHRMQRAAEHEQKLMRGLLGLKSALGAATVDELVDAYRGLALTRLADGDRRLASAYMMTAIHMKPGLKEQDFFGRAELKDLFREVKASYNLLKVFQVRVETQPSGAEVYVGDKLKGYTPLSVDGLKQGAHLLRVRKDGYYSHGWLAETHPGGRLTLSHNLRPIAGRAKLVEWVRTLQNTRTWKRNPEQITAAAAGIRRLLRCTDVVVAKVKRTSKAYVLKGAVAPHGKDPAQVDLKIPVNAELLKRVNVLTYEWVP